MNEKNEMHCYLGCSLIEAKKMTRGEFYTSRGYKIPSNINSNIDGYFVQYEGEWVSWIPKEMFEKHYFMFMTEKEDIIEEHCPSFSDIDRFIGNRFSEISEYIKGGSTIGYILGNTYKISRFCKNSDEIPIEDDDLQDEAWKILFALIHFAIDGFKDSMQKSERLS